MEREAVFLWVGDTSWILLKLQWLMLAYDLVPLVRLGMGRECLQHTEVLYLAPFDFVLQ